MLRNALPRRRLVVTALGTPELGNLVAQATTALATTNSTGAETLVASLTGETVPAPLRLIASDVASVATLTPTLPGLGRLALLWYSLFGRPAPLFGLLDYYVTGPLSETLGSRYALGGGLQTTMVRSIPCTDRTQAEHRELYAA